MTPPAAGNPQDRVIRAALVGDCLLAALLVVIILVRYPGNAATATAYRTLGGSGLAVLLTRGTWFTLRGRRLTSAADAGTTLLGVLVGLAFGLLWVLEISFNNFIPPAISTGAARTVVDSAVLAVIPVGILLVGVVAAFRTGRTRPGLLAGYWSELVSGLIACLMGLLLQTSPTHWGAHRGRFVGRPVSVVNSGYGVSSHYRSANGMTSRCTPNLWRGLCC